MFLHHFKPAFGKKEKDQLPSALISTIKEGCLLIPVSWSVGFFSRIRQKPQAEGWSEDRELVKDLDKWGVNSKGIVGLSLNAMIILP